MIKPLKIIIKAGPGQNALFILGEEELFETSQISYILQSPDTLSEQGAAIIFDASYWWFDSGRKPETLRVERKFELVEFVGRKRIEQSHGDSIVVLGQCEFINWLAEVQKLAT
jgi:hypothetical protein